MRRSKKGFTLVELSLSIAFVGVLSLIIAFLIVDAIGTYRRGITLNQVNTVGMDLVDDMRAAIQDSPSKSVVDNCNTIDDSSIAGASNKEDCKNSGGLSMVTVREMGTMETGVGEEEVPTYGAFCTGKYSYMWNSGYWFNGKNDKDESAKFNGANGFKLIKVEDGKRKVCTEYSDGVFGSLEGTEAVSLLAEDENDTTLALYDLYVPAPADNSDKGGGLFYSVSFILGTIEGGINITESGNFCVAPGDKQYGEVENFDYCAINKFNFATRATGGGK